LEGAWTPKSLDFFWLSAAVNPSAEPALQELADRRGATRHARRAAPGVERVEFLCGQHDLQTFASRHSRHRPLHQAQLLLILRKNTKYRQWVQ
jgi:hypothetical protein